VNTIRRPRRRPRLESINFRTLWWLVGFEASYLVWCRYKNGASVNTTARASYWSYHRVTWRHVTRRILATYPKLRELP
jgi:hypothetical protein